MKKIVALLVMILMIVSAIPIFAETDSIRDNSDSADSDSDDSDRVKDEIRIKEETREGNTKINTVQRIETKDGVVRTETKTRLETDNGIKERIKVKEHRILTDAMKQRAHDNFEEARLRYENARNSQHDRRKSFLDARVKLRACNDDCEALEEEILQKAKDHLYSTIERIIAHFQKLKERASGDDRLDNEHAEDILNDLEKAITKLQAIQDKIEDATSKADLQELAKQVRSIWNTMQHRGEIYATRLIASRYLHTIEKLENAKTRLAEQVGDSQELAELLERISAAIDDASENVDKAIGLLKEARDLRNDDPSKDNKENIRSKVKEAKEYLRKAKANIQDAHVGIKHFLSAKRNGTEIKETDEVEHDEKEDEIDCIAVMPACAQDSVIKEYVDDKGCTQYTCERIDCTLEETRSCDNGRTQTCILCPENADCIGATIWTNCEE